MCKFISKLNRVVTFLNKKLVKLINHRIIWVSIWAQSLVGFTLMKFKLRMNLNTNFACRADNTIPNIFLMLIGICLYEIVIFSHVILRGSRFWDAWEGFNKTDVLSRWNSLSGSYTFVVWINLFFIFLM